MTSVMTTSFANWFSASVLHSLGWTLLHFLWQGAAVAAMATVVMNLCRRASVRYVVGVSALVLMLGAPVVTFILATPAGRAVAAKSSLREPIQLTGDVKVGGEASRSLSPPRLSPFRKLPLSNAMPWLVEAWLLGVAFFSLRPVGGFLLLERARRKQSTMPNERVLEMCRMLQRRLGLDRTIRYYECLWLQAPAVIGWFRPIVMLPVTALTGLSEGQLQSVIAHELAHIRRFDTFVNLFQIAVETLLFYHPAVWWLNKRIRAEREHCCDDVAVSLCGNPVEYARALTIMEGWRSAPVLAMAANRGPLTERVFRVLGRKSIGAEMRGVGLAGGLSCLTAALVAGNALLGIANPNPVHASESNSARISEALGSLSASLPARVFQAEAASPQSNPSHASAAAKPSPAVRVEEGDQNVDRKSSKDTSYIDAMKATGLGDLTVDQLIALKIQGVTPEYVRDLRGLGLVSDASQIIALKIQGVDAAYVRGLKDAGIQPDIDQLIALKIQSVTPAYVHEVHDLGLQLDADKLVAMRIQDVTPEYIRGINALGLKPTVDELVAMRIQDVTPEYVKALQTAGFKLDVNELISAKVQDITPEFVEQAVKHGFKNLTVQKLIQLKQMGILDSQGEI
jgi:beta-lactamase regulating signal transducer with metallopeptidase domain